MICALRVPLVLLLVSAACPAALPSGFHVYEQGAKASGQAVAFVARADDASAAYYNPAAIAWFESAQFAAGFSAVRLGDVKFTSSGDGSWGFMAPVAPVISLWDNGTSDMKDHTATPIHLMYGQRFPGTRFGIGFSVTNPFGLVTDWTDPASAARYAAWKTDLRTFVYNINGVMDLGAGFAGALGVDYLDADVRAFSRWIVAPVQVSEAPPLVLPVNMLSDLTGGGGKWSWNAALHYGGAAWKLGLTYRAKFSVEADCAGIFRVLPNVHQVQELPAELTQALGALFPSGPARGALELPATMALGVAYTGLGRWEFEFDIHRIEWSAFDAVTIDFQHNTAVLDDAVVQEQWEDTTSYRFGASYRLAPNHELRLGAYVEDSAVPLRYLRPSIPDADRSGFTAGYGLQLGRFALDVYCLYIALDDLTVTRANWSIPSGPTANPVLRAAQLAEESRTGSYESSIKLIGLTGSYRF